MPDTSDRAWHLSFILRLSSFVRLQFRLHDLHHIGKINRRFTQHGDLLRQRYWVWAYPHALPVSGAHLVSANMMRVITKAPPCYDVLSKVMSLPGFMGAKLLRRPNVHQQNLSQEICYDRRTRHFSDRHRHARELPCDVVNRQPPLARLGAGGASPQYQQIEGDHSHSAKAESVILLGQLAQA